MLRIYMTGLFKYKIKGITVITFDSYWRAREYRSQL